VAIQATQEQLLAKYGPYVRSIAAAVRRQFGNRLDLEDLLAYGNIGLLEAAERFDEKIGANFLTFAHYRIRGAIFDGLRKMGVLRGADRRSAYLSDRANAYLASNAARDTGRVTPFADDVQEIEGAVMSLAAAFAVGLEGLERLQIKDESLGPEERLEHRELRERAAAALERLPDNERRLLVAYYFENKTLEEAGGALGLSKSWSSRLHARAIDRLKGLLDEESESVRDPPLKSEIRG
jgi:RNA polymerase sigma factor for flagellar operon FliA